MENMNSIKEKAKNKSCQGAPLNYKNNVVLLNPENAKKEIIKFALTAGLVIGAISLGTNEQVREYVKNQIEAMKDNNEAKEEEKALEKSFDFFENSIISSIQVAVNPATKTADVETFYNQLAKNVLNNGENGYIFLDSYIKVYGYNSKEVQNIINAISTQEQTYYTDITNFLDLKLGIKNAKDFKTYCLYLYDKNHYMTKKEKEENDLLVQANNDLTTFWVSEIQNSLDRDAKLYEFYKIYKDKNLLNELIVKLSFSEGKDYATLEQYLAVNGFNTKEEWENYHLDNMKGQSR